MAPRKKAVPVQAESESLASLLGMEEYTPPVIEEYKDTKYSPFDFMNQISMGKSNLIVDEATERQYSAFLVNKGLSNSMDCIMWANEMNSRPHIPNRAQNMFLLGVIPKRKRFDKWAKIEDIENLDLVMGFYNVSRIKAIQMLSILTPENIEYLKKKTFKGGIMK